MYSSNKVREKMDKDQIWKTVITTKSWNSYEILTKV